MPSLTIPDLPKGYKIRRIEVEDYERGAIEPLKALTSVGSVTKKLFTSIVNDWNKNNDIYHVLVIVTPQNIVAAIGSIIIESKIIHQGGKVGHIEDIAVNPSQQGNHLGLCLIRNLLSIGKENGCYKVILDCDPKNEKFYVKCGLQKAGYEMEYRF